MENIPIFTCFIIMDAHTKNILLPAMLCEDTEGVLSSILVEKISCLCDNYNIFHSNERGFSS